MKRMYSVMMVGVMLSASVFAATYGGGSGTEADPYQIWTPEQMNTIGLNSGDWGKSFKLMADIDMGVYSGTQYNIIGNDTTVFTGTFDGDRHAIRNLTYSTTASEIMYVGVFGKTDSAAIENVRIENAVMNTLSSYAGGLVGYQIGGTIMNCHSTGTIACRYIGGGLVGWMDSGTITHCSSTATVTVNNYGTGFYFTYYSYAGGLAGYQRSGTITCCHSTGTVMASTVDSSNYAYTVAVAGGLVGTSEQCGISTCYSTGVVRVNAETVYTGGLLGDTGSTATACFWDNQTSGQTTSPGGSGVQGKTTAEMRSLSTFTAAGWDFSSTDGDEADWIMPAAGYPVLAWKGCAEYPAGDSNQDCRVDLDDLMIVAANWLTCTAVTCN